MTHVQCDGGRQMVGKTAIRADGKNAPRKPAKPAPFIILPGQSWWQSEPLRVANQPVASNQN